MDLLSQKLTRREFLVKAGLLLLAATGIAGMLKRFTSFGSKDNTPGGYGSSKYGN